MQVCSKVFLTFFLVLIVGGVQAAEVAQTKVKTPVQSEVDNQQKSKVSQMPMVKLETTMGDIVFELNADKAPITVNNFIDYVNRGHYNNLIFHRVISGFMVQGGGMTSDMTDVPTQAAIKNEAANGLKNVRGSIAMARTNDPDSATAQFFINVADNDFLNYKFGNPGYAVFGRVAEGMNVIDAISKVKTGRNKYHDDVPVTPILIKRATILSALNASKDGESGTIKKGKEVKEK